MLIPIIIGFMQTAASDPRLTTAHISLYLVLLLQWHSIQEDPISFSRPDVMSAAKISSRATYHKCMKELNEWGYIRYIPSHHPVLGSLVYLNINAVENALAS